MAETPFDQYGKRALQVKNFAEIAGRYSFQKSAEKYILHDLLKKLSLSTEDDVLDIGCGAGNLLIPVSFFVRSITGIDHPNLLARARGRLPEDCESITLIPGDFLKTRVTKKYSKIYIYGVIHVLRSDKDVLSFIRKAALLLRPNGKMLVGDIPNKDIKDKFLASEKGKKFLVEWKEQVEQERKKNPDVNQPFTATTLVQIDNALVEKIIAMLKKMGLRVKRLKQTANLAFGNTREDILVEKV